MYTLKVSKKVLGKNIKIGKNFTASCKEKVNNILVKYSTKVLRYSTTLEKKKNFYKVKIQIVLKRKITLSTIGRDQDANKALDLALYNTSKMVRRYIRKLKSQKKNRFEVLNYKEELLDNIIKDRSIS